MCSKPDEPNVCAKVGWIQSGGWASYHQNLGGGTDGGVYRGRMESQVVGAEPNGQSMQYISSEEDGRTKLSFVSELGWFGTEPFTGWKFTGCAHNASCRYTDERYEHNLKRHKANDFDYNYTSITEAFGSYGTSFRDQYLDTTYAFYNRGLWGQIQEEKAKKMMASLHDITGGNEKQFNRCFFKSTTGCERSRDINLVNMEYGPVRKASYAAGCEYFDVSHLTDEFSMMLFLLPPPPRNLMFEFRTIFWDSVHYQPWVYEELSNVLLNVLCNAPDRSL